MVKGIKYKSPSLSTVYYILSLTSSAFLIADSLFLSDV